MKRIFVLIASILIIFMYVGCEEKAKYDAANVQSETPQEKDKILLLQKINEYLSMTVAEIIKSTGAEIDTGGTLSILESHAFFPCIYPKNLPFYFICRNYDEEETPLYIEPYEDSLDDCLYLLNLSQDMVFTEIMDIMGQTHIKKTWLASEEDKAYRIDYAMDGLSYTFWSYNEDGSCFSLYIGLDN